LPVATRRALFASPRGCAPAASPAHYREFSAEYRRRVAADLRAGPYLHAFERLLLRGRLP